jgi:hypothetical protein
MPIEHSNGIHDKELFCFDESRNRVSIYDTTPRSGCTKSRTERVTLNVGKDRVCNIIV